MAYPPLHLLLKEIHRLTKIGAIRTVFSGPVLAGVDCTSCWSCKDSKGDKAWLLAECDEDRAPSQYPKRRLSVRSRQVSKPRDLYLELSDRSEIWQALRQQCCRCACQISKRYDNLKYQSRGFETSQDLTKRRLFGYWDGAQVAGMLLNCLTRHIISRHGWMTTYVCNMIHFYFRDQHGMIQHFLVKSTEKIWQDIAT